MTRYKSLKLLIKKRGIFEFRRTFDNLGKKKIFFGHSKLLLLNLFHYSDLIRTSSYFYHSLSTVGRFRFIYEWLPLRRRFSTSTVCPAGDADCAARQFAVCLRFSWNRPSRRVSPRLTSLLAGSSLIGSCFAFPRVRLLRTSKKDRKANICPPNARHPCEMCEIDMRW